MIKNIEITGRNKYEVSDDLDKYVRNKIGKLDKYMSRQARKNVSAEVKLTEGETKTKNRNKCEVILHIPGDRVTASEATINMFAAVDIVEAKLKNQLRRQKEKSVRKKKGDRKKVFGRIRDKEARDFWGSQD
jgi:putative sigma-54 modulation protein